MPTDRKANSIHTKNEIFIVNLIGRRRGIEFYPTPTYEGFDAIGMFGPYLYILEVRCLNKMFHYDCMDEKKYNKIMALQDPEAALDVARSFNPEIPWDVDAKRLNVAPWFATHFPNPEHGCLTRLYDMRTPPVPKDTRTVNNQIGPRVQTNWFETDAIATYHENIGAIPPPRVDREYHDWKRARGSHNGELPGVALPMPRKL